MWREGRKVRYQFVRSEQMSSNSTEVRVGIAVILAAVILILGILWIGEFRLARRWETYSVRFDEVGGLSVGDPVAVSGVEMGKVGSISLKDGRVTTDLLIEDEVVLRDDCSVEIRSIGLMGEKFVYIMPGRSGEILPPGSVIEGDYKAGLPEVVAGMGDIMDDMEAAAQSLRAVVAAQGGGYTLGESLAKIDKVAAEILTLLRENKDDIRSGTRAMKTVSTDLRDMVSGHKEEVAQGIQRFSAAAARLDSITLSLQEIVAGVEEGEGTLGMLIKEKKLHEDMEAALADLKYLIKDIKEHPERYLTIELF